MTVISLPRVAHEQQQTRAITPRAETLETSAGRIRLSVFNDFELIGKEWRAFQTSAVCVQAQSFEFAKTWFRVVSKARGARLAIVCGRSQSGELEFIWPFEIAKWRGVSCLHWVGWEHANYNMGLHTLNFARKASPQDMKALLGEAARLIGDVDAAYFDHQPYEWDGVANPMALMPSSPSANQGHSVLLETDFDMLYRNRFSGKSRNTQRRKEKRLRQHAPVEMGWAQTPEERRHLLDSFFKQKAQQFAEQGISNAFADPRVREYYHELAARPSGEQGTLEIGYLKSGDQIAAISSGAYFKDKFSTMLTSIDKGPIRKFSPGSLLILYQIKDACRNGLNFFDMGAGNARHKEEWCDIHTPLFDSVITFNKRGYFLTGPLALGSAVKRFIKTRAKLWHLTQTLRRKLFGRDIRSD